jgi:hypothetical protein
MFLRNIAAYYIAGCQNTVKELKMETTRILCRLSPVPTLQHPLSISVHCILPPSSGTSKWSTPSYVYFQCFLGTLSSFIPITWPTHWNLLILYFWLAPFTCYQFRDYTCFATVHLQTRVHRFFLELFSQNALSIFFLICNNVRDSPFAIRRTLISVLYNFILVFLRTSLDSLLGIWSCCNVSTTGNI